MVCYILNARRHVCHFQRALTCGMRPFENLPWHVVALGTTLYEAHACTCIPIAQISKACSKTKTQPIQTHTTRCMHKLLHMCACTLNTHQVGQGGAGGGRVHAAALSTPVRGQGAAWAGRLLAASLHAARHARDSLHALHAGGVGVHVGPCSGDGPCHHVQPLARHDNLYQALGRRGSATPPDQRHADALGAALRHAGSRGSASRHATSCCSGRQEQAR